MDLHNMSTSELHNLQRDLINELKERNTNYKESLGLYRSLYSEFGGELTSTGLDDLDVASIIHRLARSITLLCDYTLGNYATVVKNSGARNKVMTAAKRTISDGVIDEYKKMADDILEVIKSYRR